MNRKAQASLEYLMTYGWALVLIATVIGALVFIVSEPSTLTFSSSDPTKILLKAGAIAGADTEVQLQNITGGKITITSILSNQFTGCAIDQQTTPVDIGAGSQMTLKCGAPGDNKGSIRLDYTDHAGLDRTAIIIVSGGGVVAEVGLVGFYSFNEGDGTTTADSSLTGLTGTLVGPPSWSSDCISGSCLVFDGDGDYVNFGTSPAFDPLDFTYKAWIKPSTISGTKGVVTHGSRSFGISGGRLVYEDNAGTAPAGATTMTPGTWYRVGVTYDATADELIFYLNGSNDNPGGTPITWNAPSTAGQTMRIGFWRCGSASYCFPGAMDEVKIYDRTLEPNEMLS